jgi:hypothetical protein
MPVVWLFAVSTISLEFVVWMHIFIWLAAVVFARDFIVRQTSGRARSAAQLWLLLVVVVSFQMTTYFRPVLWRGRGAPMFEHAKISFFEHLGQVDDWQPPKAAPQASSASR